MRYPKNRVIFCVAVILLVFLPKIKVFAENKDISFVELMPNPDGADTNANEYFKLKNYSTEDRNIDNYKVCNISGDCYLLKGGIAAGACQKILRTDFNFTLHNDKEELNLFDSSENLLDHISTGSAPSGKARLCSESYCDWGDPRESCEYSDIIDPVTLPQNNENEENENNNKDDVTPLPEFNNISDDRNTSDSPPKPEKIVFKIASAKDWGKAKKEMNSKNLLSLAVDTKGEVVVPYNIIKNNSFYISASGKLVLVNVYASRQDEFKNLAALYQKGARIKISKGILKNSQEPWQIGIGKGAGIETGKRNTNNREKEVNISGIIIKKSGQYFYIADEKYDKRPVTVYIPTVIWNKYLDKENIGTFPRLIGNKVITATSYKDKEIKISGVKETSGNTYRILVVDENNIEISEENIIDQKKENISNVSPVAVVNKVATIPDQKLTPTITETKGDDVKMTDIQTTLAQKLSWRNFWNIFTTKIKILKDKLF